MKTFVLIVLATFTAVAVAENTQRTGADQAKAQRTAQQVSQYSSTSCQSTFTSFAGNSYLSFCVSGNGNVSTLESPKTFSQIFLGGEGYGICDMTKQVSYDDWGVYGDSNNWFDSVLTQPNGPNTFPLTITRSTLDGAWTLKQVFSRNSSAPSVTIKMTLKNNSSASKSVELARFADIDADGTSDGDSFDYNRLSSWGSQHSALGHGLMMHSPVAEIQGGSSYLPAIRTPATPSSYRPLTVAMLPRFTNGCDMKLHV